VLPPSSSDTSTSLGAFQWCPSPSHTEPACHMSCYITWMLQLVRVRLHVICTASVLQNMHVI
jgi:hypothetical protein